MALAEFPDLDLLAYQHAVTTKAWIRIHYEG
jgi:hypothetical protein